MKMKAFRLRMKTRRPEHRIDYELQRNETERIKRREKAKAWSKIGRDVKEDHTGTKKLLFSMAKNYRGKNNEVSYDIKDKEDNLLVDPEKISERWREYFEDLLNPERSIDDNNEQDIDKSLEENQEEWPITEQELQTAMRAMKNGKAMREDGIPVELVKVAGQTAMTELLDLCNTALRREEVPEGWQRGVICPIYKKR